VSSIAADLVKLTHSARIELFVLDATALGGDVYHFHAGTNALRGEVVWQGQAYTPFPVKASGFEVSASGPLPRPKLVVSNVLGLIGALNREYSNLEGATLTRKRTLARFLDAVNFPGGVNAEADPNAGYADDLWIIDRRSHQDDLVVEYELASPIDLAGLYLPARQVIARSCTVAYRSSECGYTGTSYWDRNDAAVASADLDRCGQRQSSCKLRFPGSDGVPFGGFPGAGLMRQV
jgi:lambda family phage minor tail protein L